MKHYGRFIMGVFFFCFLIIFQNQYILIMGCGKFKVPVQSRLLPGCILSFVLSVIRVVLV